MAKLIGTDPNQVPSNADLGTMAYLDYDALKPQLLAGGNRNLIINGAMQVAQRGTSVTTAPSGYNTVDRFATSHYGTSAAATETQSSDAPDGFSSSKKIEITTADTSTSGTKWWLISHKLEGQDLQQIQKGTSGAKSMTLSFYVKSNLVGDFAVGLTDEDNSRNVSYLYTIESANTWQKVTWLIPPDTTGSFDNDNNASLQISWFLSQGIFTTGTLNTSWQTQSNGNRGPGTSHLIGTVGNTFQITGVQLEVGDTATPFEHRSYGDELARCKRYYEQSYAAGVAAATETSSGAHWQSNVSNRYSDTLATVGFAVEKRANPTLTFYPHTGTKTANTGFLERGTTVSYPTITVWVNSTKRIICYAGVGSAYVQAQLIFHWIADAEL